MRSKICLTLVLACGSALAQFPKQGPTMGGGSVAEGMATNTQQQINCAQLAQERRAIDQITEKMQWVPIEQQNANYHRMNWLKGQMAARGCSY
jgi:hypothetical protein